MLTSDFNTRLCDKLIRVTYTLTMEGCTRIDTADAHSMDPIELVDLAWYARVSPEEMVAWLRMRVVEHNESELAHAER